MHYFIRCCNLIISWFCHSAFISRNFSIKKNFCSSTIWLHSLYSKRKINAFFFPFIFQFFCIFGALATLKVISESSFILNSCILMCLLQSIGAIILLRHKCPSLACNSPLKVVSWVLLTQPQWSLITSMSPIMVRCSMFILYISCRNMPSVISPRTVGSFQ